jgi:filamentous hemagglutinin family protein
MLLCPRAVSRQPSSVMLRKPFLLTASMLALFVGVGDLAQARPLGASTASSSATSVASEAAAAAAAAAQAAAKQSLASMSRAVQAMQAMKAAQAAARSAANAGLANGVADGLSPGGLVVDPRVGSDPNLWINAKLPTQSNADGKTTVTVSQTAQRAVMTWQQFNVGRNTVVNFDQSGGDSANGNSWVALNRIDATGAPSQIQGQIKAQGTVLLINPNGIIFNGSSQINVHSLIASTLDVSSALGFYLPVMVNGSTLTMPDGTAVLAPSNEDNANTAFVANGLYTGQSPTLRLTTNPLPGPAGPGIVVQPGAVISTDVSGFDNGGYVALIGKTVTNRGSISTPAGQIALAAGTSVTLTPPTTGSNNPTSLALTSDFVAGSTVTNDVGGMLTAARGNITLIGDTVNQYGLAETTTSITRAGSLILSGNTSVNLGSSSVSAILPDENGESIPLNSLSSFVAPSITITSNAFDMKGRTVDEPGALIDAPGANMVVVSSSVSGDGQVFPGGRAFLESGSLIDLGGLVATASLSNYLFTFKVTANDVADSPLAQGLIGQTVTIDLRKTGTRADGLAWVGSPLFSSSASGYLGDIPQTIDQLLARGGSLSFPSITGTNRNQPLLDVLQAQGALINISGGAIVYSGGVVATTRLAGADGRIYDIANADPFMGYQGLAGQFTVNHAHWGITEIFTSPFASGAHYEPSYVDGMSAGALSITAANPVLEGSLLASAYVSGRQAAFAQTDTGKNGSQSVPDELPMGGALTIKTLSNGSPIDAIVLQSAPSNVLGPDFTIDSNLVLPTMSLASGGTVKAISYSTDALSAMGLSSISISSGSALSLATGATLTVNPGGSISLGGVTSIDGALVAHGGKVSVAGYSGGVPFYNGPPPTSEVTIGSNALIDVSGLWVNDRGADAAQVQGAAHINGGSVTIQTYAEATWPDRVDVTQSIVLASGSVIDLTSGGYVGTNGSLKMASKGVPAGVGGDLSLLTYAVNPGGNGGGRWRDPNGNYSFGAPGNVAPSGAPTAANISIEGTIYSGGLAQGGNFALQAPSIRIGGVDTVTSYLSGAQAGEIDLPASFFRSNGFSSYSLTSVYGDVTVVAGTTLLLQQQNYRLLAAPNLPASGTVLRSFATLGLAPDGLRHAVNLSLSESAYAFGSPGDVSNSAGVVLERGARIVAEPTASVRFTADGPVSVLGSIIARGGNITLANIGSPSSNSSTDYTNAPLDVWVGADAVLDVSGIFLPDPLVTAYRTGHMLPGGAITLQGGTVVALPGSTFDLQGASGTIEVPGGALSHFAEQPVWSDGGVLSILPSSAIYSGQGLYQAAYFAGTVSAQGGAPQAAGGTLVVGGLAGGSNGYGAVIISQSGDVTAGLNGAALNNGAYPRTVSELGSALPSTASTALITADTLTNSGFASVNLIATTIGFSGNVSFKVPGSLMLAGNLKLLPAGSTDISFTAPSIGATVVDIAANYMSLLSNKNVQPVLSDGVLNLSATAQIDLAGWIGVSNAAHVNLASGGDIRLVSSADAQYTTGILSYPSSDGGTSGYFRNLLSAPGALFVPSDLTLTAREIYPTTESAFLLMSTGLGSADGIVNTITIASNGRAPAVPLSVAGEIVVDASSIVQGGALMAPLGLIQLGFSAGESLPSAWTSAFADLPAAQPTQSLTLKSGSLTSATLAGLDVPFGYTVNGTNWTTSDPVLRAVLGDDQAAIKLPVLTAPPSKLIALNGAAVSTETGAVIDLRGGGDIYATEFVPGTGGSRNVLTSAGSGQAVYALVPGYTSPIAANDPIYGKPVGIGTSVTLPGGNGIAAGTYTLMPAIYATQPGAYRVVVVSTNAGVGTRGSVAPDGSIYMTGTLGNAITGSRSSQIALLEIQPAKTWTRYSEIDITSANSYFSALAAANGAAPPVLPIDAGQLVLNATRSVALRGSNDFTPAPGGRGGLVDISGTNLAVIASDRPDEAASYLDAGYVVLDSDQISHLGAQSLLIGGTRSQVSNGLLISSTASNVVVATDAAHPLSGPEVLLVATPTGTETWISIDDPGYGDQVTVLNQASLGSISVLPGSAILATGGVSSGWTTYLGQNPQLPTTLSETDIWFNWTTNFLQPPIYKNPLGDFYKQAYSGALSALLQVSNGPAVIVQRGEAGQALPTVTTVDDIYATLGLPSPAPNYIVSLPDLAPIASISIGAGATIAGGNTLQLNGGDLTFGAGAAISGNGITLASSSINVGNAPAGASGLTLSSAIIGQLAAAQSVTLISGSGFNFYDVGGISLGDAAHRIGTLTLDGSGLYSAGGTTTIAANDLVLTDSQTSPNVGNAPGGSGGMLILDASGSITFGSGAKTIGSYARAQVSAGRQIVFSGSGSMDAGAASVALVTPGVVVDAAANQSLTTTGALNLLSVAGAAPTVSPATVAGKLTLTGGSIYDSTTLTGFGGDITFAATDGDIVLDRGARVVATGSEILLFDHAMDTQGGKVTLSTPAGNVIINPGAVVDVSGAGVGYAGELTIKANGTAALNGSLVGGAAYQELGGAFTLSAANYAGNLPLDGSFTRRFAVTLNNGDIVLAQGQTLTAGEVLLEADHGSVIVDGTIDASGPTGGVIALYANGTGSAAAGTAGASGVTIGSTARLLATYRSVDPDNPAYGSGSSALVQNGGTVILGTTGTPDGTYNATYGYENVAGSGAVTVASGATFDVSGGPGGANISNHGGVVVVRAPLLTTGNVNVSFQGTVITSRHGGPSGAGVALNAYAVWSTSDATTGNQHFDGIIDPAGFFDGSGNRIVSASNGLYPGSTYDDPAPGAYLPHVGFYQKTLLDFVNAPFADANAVAADFAGASGIAPGALLHLAPEIVLVNPATGTNNGNITVASNWNLGSGNVVNGVYTPYYRTHGSVDAGEPGVLTLRAVNNVQINATISDGFYQSSDPFYEASLGRADPANGIGLAANQIANNPQVASNPAWGNGVFVNDYNTTTAASDLMSITTGINNGSFAYDFVAGAAGLAGAPAANPRQVVAVPAGSITTGAAPQYSVTIDGYAAYTNPDQDYMGRNLSILVPTVVRTGTGSIDVIAAGSVEFLNSTAPGAIYTAGALAPNAADFTAPQLVPMWNQAWGLHGFSGLLSRPQWASNGGAVTVAAGDSIVGIETTVDADGTQTGTIGASTAEFWTAWYFTYAHSTGEQLTPFDPSEGGGQTATWINYNTFFQGIGALGGGNVRVRASGNIYDVSVSLPETIQVSGGQYQSGPAVAAHYYGGGDLVVETGGNLYSSSFYVGRGTGIIRVGGSVLADPQNPVTGLATALAPETTPYNTNPNLQILGPALSLPLLLAQQDSFIGLEARGPIDLGGVFDPGTMTNQTFMANGKISNAAPDKYYLQSILTTVGLGAQFNTYGANSGLSVIANSGNLDFYTVSNISDFIAGNEFSIAPGSLPANVTAQAVLGDLTLGTDPARAITYADPQRILSVTPSANGTVTLLAGGSISTIPGELVTTLIMTDGIASSNVGASLLGAPLPTMLATALHADDSVPAYIYAGADITGAFELNKAARVQAGHDMINVNFVGINASPGDVTSIIAGNDIIAREMLITGGFSNGNSSFQLYGPGTFLVQAGRNLGPFFTGPVSGSLWNGIATIGDGSNLDTTTTIPGAPSRGVLSYLPVQGANLYVLFGVGGGIDYAAAANYIDPATAGSGGIDYLGDIAVQLGVPRDQAWPAYQKLSASQQHVLIDRAFLDFLGEVGIDYNNASSPYYHQYARAYETIATLFPARLGYTNNAPGGTNGTASIKSTGSLSMAQSLLETQLGGDINIIGPGGGIVVGINATDKLKPSREGILTLQGGSIRSYTDKNVIVDQSRIFTEQGGDITMFSANGDLNAGKGPKSSAAFPPLTLICDADSYCRVNPAGLVTGAGIGALITLPDQDPSLSNVNLIAPRGTIDAGAAGIRVSGSLNLVALQIVNAFNIQVGGTATGLPTVQGPPVAALTLANNVAGSAIKTEGPPQNAAPETGSIIMVEFLGFGGSDGATPAPSDSLRQVEPAPGKDRRTQDRNSPYQILGTGDMTVDEAKQLIADRRKLMRP